MENNNNNVKLFGKFHGEFKYDHECFGEKFHKGILDVKRTSGTIDEIPVLVSNRLINIKYDWSSKQIEVVGDFRSYMHRVDGKNKLDIYVFAREINLVDDEPQLNNHVYLNGYICKAPGYRETPFGREISDLLIAVNRQYGKSDYIPCIAWGRTARFASTLDVGTNIVINGRIQSRQFNKQVGDSQEIKTVYELSICKLETEDV